MGLGAAVARLDRFPPDVRRDLVSPHRPTAGLGGVRALCRPILDGLDRRRRLRQPTEEPALSSACAFPGAAVDDAFRFPESDTWVQLAVALNRLDLPALSN